MIHLSQFEAVIFDMDGVLIDSEPLWKIAMEEVFHSLGSTLTKSDFQKTVGLRIDEVIHFWNIHENWGVKDEQEVEEAIIVKMIELISQHAAPLAGVIETLDYLKSQNIKIGLGTSSSNRLIQVVLNELRIHSYFDVTHSAENEAFGKPHPAVYLHVAQELGVSPNKCLVIEDSLNGVIAGLAAKMKVVCIPEKTHHPNPKLSVADFHFDSMSDFLHEIAQ
jgi:HAD superfamily hydrolase (TIGR01509 family)